jgi:hypothetical protein
MIKKIFRFFRFSVLIISFLFLLLPFMFFSVVNKGVKKAKHLLGFKKSADDQLFFDNVDNQAWADVPGGGGGGGGGGSTPFLAVWDGKEYVFENDVLFSANDNYSPSFIKSKIRYESGLCGPDLYKIRNNPKTGNSGEIKFQIQERDPEESFIDHLKVFRVIHEKSREILVDNKYEKFYSLEKNKIEKAILPEQVSINGKKAEPGKIFGKHFLEESNGIRLHYRQNVSLGFKGVKPGKNNYLILKVKERGWSPVAKTLFTVFPAIRFLALAFTGFVLPWFFGGAVSILPFIILGDGNRSINLFCKNRGSFKFFGSVHPRMKESVELVAIPEQAISADGRIDLNLEWTRTHHLVSIGIIDFAEDESRNYEIEELKLIKAIHNRNNKNHASLLGSRDLNYLHTVQGDTVDLVFRSQKNDNKNDKQHTYLFSASGFYTDLRPQYQMSFKNLFWLLKEEIKA